MEWPQNPPKSPGLLLPDSLQNKVNFSSDLMFTLNYLLPRVWITANMSLGFIPVELIIRAPTIISCLAVILIPISLLILKLMISNCLLDKNISMSHKQTKLGVSSWSHDAPLPLPPAFPISVISQVRWSSCSNYRSQNCAHIFSFLYLIFLISQILSILPYTCFPICCFSSNSPPTHLLPGL